MMNVNLETWLYIGLGISASFIVALVIRIFILSRKNNKLNVALVEEFSKNLNQEDSVQESFLKFVSDSRELAYEYIEEVQSGLELFAQEVGPVIEHWDKYGSAISSPLNENIKTISNAYKNLITLLPNEIEDKKASK